MPPRMVARAYLARRGGSLTPAEAPTFLACSSSLPLSWGNFSKSREFGGSGIQCPQTWKHKLQPALGNPGVPETLTLGEMLLCLLAKQGVPPSRSP